MKKSKRILAYFLSICMILTCFSTNIYAASNVTGVGESLETMTMDSQSAKTVVEDTQAGDTQTKDTQTEETPTEGTSTEETLTEGTSTEGTPAEDKQSQDTQSEDAQSADAEEENVLQNEAENMEQKAAGEDLAAAFNPELEYALVEHAQITSPDTQSFGILLSQVTGKIEKAVLYITDSSGAQEALEASKINENGLLFEKTYDDEKKSGIYTATALHLESDAGSKNIAFSELNMNMQYAVNQEYTLNGEKVVDYSEVSALSEDVSVDADIVTFDAEGNTISQESIGDALATAGAEKTGEGSISAKADMVIYLDPGHDSTHAGAQGNGLSEETLNFKIAQYCKAELETYAGVKVYMCRSSYACPYPGTTSAVCNSHRVDDAKSKGADVYVALHCNASDSSTVNGALVFCQNNNYQPTIGAAGQALGQKILDQLVALGLQISWSGVVTQESQNNTKYPDGSLADYYQINRLCKLAGMPGIIVEHAFITGTSDAQKYLSSEESLQKLGIADATGIANYYGLSKTGAVTLRLSAASPQVAGKTIQLSAGGNTTGKTFRFLEYYDGYWKELQGFSSDSTYDWTPAKSGGYLLCMEHKDMSGTVTQLFEAYSIKEPTVSITSLAAAPVVNDISYALEAKVNTDAPALKYEFWAINTSISDGKWEKVNTTDSSNTVTWTPKRSGSYVIQVNVITYTGKTTSAAIGTSVENRAYVTDMTFSHKSPQVFGQSITMSGQIKKLAEEPLTYRFLAYNGAYWEELSKSATNSCTWKPKEVKSYLLCIELYDSANKLMLQHFQSYEIQEPKVELKGVKINEGENGKINLSANITTNDTNATYHYQVYEDATKKWSEAGTSTNNQTVVWTPKNSGLYLVDLHVTTASNKTYESYTLYNVASGVNINSFKTSALSPQQAGSSITLTGDISKYYESEAVTYEFLAYYQGYWKKISSSTTSMQTVWHPQDAGNYLLCFQVIDKAGHVEQKFMAYGITASSFKINGIQVTPGSNHQYRLAANTTGSANGASYYYQYYNVGTGKWYKVAEKSGSSSAVWTPGCGGTYLLYLEVTLPNGAFYTYDMAYYVEGAKITGFTTSQASPQVVNTEITLKGTASNAFGEKLTYEYLVYNGAYWERIDSSDTQKTAVWKPKVKGDYLLCYQVIDSSGNVLQKFAGYAIKSSSITINEIHVDKLSEASMKLTAKVTGANALTQYRFQYYNISKGTWSLLQNWSTASSATWYPAASGSYLINLETKDGSGNISSFAAGYVVKPSASITGFTVTDDSKEGVGMSVVLDGKAATSLKENLTYEYLVYNGYYWESLSKSNVSQKFVWSPSSVGNYLLCYQVTDGAGNVVQSFKGIGIKWIYSATLGKKLADYACTFVGKLPYVYGTNDLSVSVDCSGFVQAIYAKYGYSVPRTSSEQRTAGIGVSYAEAAPGDIVCYDGHVGIYIGSGQIVHASNETDGVKISNAAYTQILAVRRIIY